MAERGSGARIAVALVQAVVAAVVLLALTAGLDVLARNAARSLLVDTLERSVGVSQPPEVTLAGRWFLPQVVGGRYRRVDVVAVGITSGPLRIAEVEATLTDVSLPFHDVLVRDLGAVGVGRSSERARLRWDDLNAYLDASAQSVTVGPGPDGTVALSGSVTVLGRRLDATADATVSVADGQLRIVPTSVTTTAAATRSTRLLLGQRLRLTVPLDSLPFGQTLDGVAVGPDGIEVTASGSDVVIRP